ncbi:hypothetical protein ANN_20743, partial [Periplaneta americana]
LREEQRLRVFENNVLRKIFGAKRDEVTGEWRKLHNVELHAFYSSPDIIKNIKSRRLRWTGHVARMGEYRNAYRMLVGRPEGKRPLGRPRRRWEDIKMDLRKVGYDDRDWINLAQDRDRWRTYVRAAMNLRVHIDQSYLQRMKRDHNGGGGGGGGGGDGGGDEDDDDIIIITFWSSSSLSDIVRVLLVFYLVFGGIYPQRREVNFNCLKTSLNLTSDTKKALPMRQLGQEIMGCCARDTRCVRPRSSSYFPYQRVRKRGPGLRWAVILNYGLFNDSRNCRGYISVTGVPEFCPAGVLFHASKSTDMSLSHLSTLKCHRPGPSTEGQRYNDYATQVDQMASSEAHWSFRLCSLLTLLL